MVSLTGRSGRTFHGPWRTAEVAVVPPARVDDLRACRPLGGGRIHLGVVEEAMTVCGRLPFRGEPHPVGAADCLRCLRSNVTTTRHDEQLAAHDRLVALAGTLVAATADRLWLRLAHRDPHQVPALLDAMVGAIVHDVPGAPDVDRTLAQVRRHREVASGAVRRWAAAEARARLERQLPRVVAAHPSRLDEPIMRQLGLASDLLDPVEVAELLVAMLETHGPAPALEPIVLRAARRAGNGVSDRVDRWRRIHAVAETFGAR